MNVLYILGSGRTGSTILGQMLNAGEGIFFGGELIDFWVRGMEENRLCSCFQPASECDVWGPIIDQLHRIVPEAQIKAMIRLRSSQSLIERVLRVGSHWMPWLGGGEANSIKAMNRILYQTIQSVTGCRLIVDSSKFSHYAGSLAEIPELEMSYLHLVRDPRAVAHSWNRLKPIPDPTDQLFVPRFGSIGSTLRWLERNYSASGLGVRNPGRYSLMRYEDFVADPVESIDRAWQGCGLEERFGDFQFDMDQGLPVNHAIWGNPSRFHAGRIAIKRDDAWQVEQPAWQRRLVSLLASPGLARYGYQ